MRINLSGRTDRESQKKWSVQWEFRTAQISFLPQYRLPAAAVTGCLRGSRLADLPVAPGYGAHSHGEGQQHSHDKSG